MYWLRHICAQHFYLAATTNVARMDVLNVSEVGPRILGMEYVQDSVDLVQDMWDYIQKADRSALQWLWDLRAGHEDTLRSPLFPVIVSVVFYFMCCAPFMVMDTVGRDWWWVKKYKIQPGQVVPWRLIRTCVLVEVWNNLVYVLPLAVAQFVWVPPTPLPPLAPSASEFVFHILACMVLFDLEYFLLHWAFHTNKFLYKHIHEFHHHHHSPSAWTTQYLHPLELIAVGGGVTTAPWILGSHALTAWVFQLIAIVVSVEEHIGYDLPIGPHNWVPFNLMGGAPKHDMHHYRPTTNYQPWFNTWDRVVGTYFPFKRAGGLTQEQFEKLSWKKKWLL